MRSSNRDPRFSIRGRGITGDSNALMGLAYTEEQALREAQEIARQTGQTMRVYRYVDTPRETKQVKLYEVKGNPTKMTSKQIVDQIRPGDTVTFRDRFGRACKGKAVMFGPSGWVLNMGGKYGTPAVVNESKIEKVTRSRSAASGYASRVLGKQNPATAYEIYNEKTGQTMGREFPTKAEADNFIRYLKAGTNLKLYWKSRKRNPAGYIDSLGRFRPIRSGTRYGNYKGKRMQWQDATPYDDAKATGGYKSSWSAKLKAATKKAKKSTSAAKSKKRNPKMWSVPSLTNLRTDNLSQGRDKELQDILLMDRKEIRELIESQEGKNLYPGAVAWYRKQSRKGTTPTDEIKMYIANDLCEAFGVEYIPRGNNSRSPAITYLNRGDSYKPTLLLINGYFKVGSWGDKVEKGNYA